MACVYILFSESADKYYIGSTKELAQRISYHMHKEFATGYTAKYQDWRLFHKIDNLTITQARKIESHIKRMKSRKYIENLKRYPEIGKKLLDKYK